MTRTPSANRSRRESRSRPKAAKVSGSPPVPRPSWSRPPLMVSTTAASSATRIGSSSGRITIAVPSWMRRVRSAAAARNVSVDGSRAPPLRKWCWATQPLSYPSSSAAANRSSAIRYESRGVVADVEVGEEAKSEAHGVASPRLQPLFPAGATRV